MHALLCSEATKANMRKTPMIILLALISRAHGRSYPARTHLQSQVAQDSRPLSFEHVSPYPVSRPTTSYPLELPASPYPVYRPRPLRHSPVEIPRSPYSTKQARIRAAAEEQKSFATSNIQAATAAQTNTASTIPSGKRQAFFHFLRQGFQGKYFRPQSPMTLMQADVPARSLNVISVATVALFCLLAGVLWFRRDASFMGDKPLLHA